MNRWKRVAPRAPRGLGILLAVTVVSPGIALPQTPLAVRLADELRAADGRANSLFGVSLDRDGRTVAMGASLRDGAELRSGAAYVFVESGGAWAEQAKLVASDAGHDHNLGIDVALEGDTLAVGAWLADGTQPGAGAVYVFEREGTTWTEVAKISAADGQSGDHFGVSVALEGDTLAVGSQRNLPAGAVYVYRGAGASWALEAKLAPSDASGGELFGGAVALSGDTLVGGAAYDNQGSTTNSGSAYVFVRSGTRWSEQRKLLPSKIQTDEFFGRTLAIDGDTVVVGAPSDGVGSDDVGEVYVFERVGTTWSAPERLVPRDAAGNRGYGSAVALEGDRAAVGAPGYGDAHLFEREAGVWTERCQTPSPAGGFSDRFGAALDLEGASYLVGAPLDDVQGSFAGAVYAFEIEPGAATYCTAKTNSLGCLPAIDADGVPSAFFPTGFVVEARNVRNQRVGLLLYGVDGPAAVPFDGGTLCVRAPLRRAPPVSSGGSPPPNQDCSGVFSIDMNAFAAGALGGSPLPELRVYGTEVHTQFWGRDVPGSSALSDGLRYFVCW